MKITKFAHACVLVETADRVALFDPGGYTWNDGSFDLGAIKHVDRIAITHNHRDHYLPEFLRAILDKFPGSHVVCNDEVKASIQADGIKANFRGHETSCLKPFEAPHEEIRALSGGDAPQNNGFHFKDEFSHPGDSFSFNETKRVLAMPLTAPWGSVMQGLNKVFEFKPEKFFLIHDWHYNDFARQWLQEGIEKRFKDSEIEFIKFRIGETIEV